MPHTRGEEQRSGKVGWPSHVYSCGWVSGSRALHFRLKSESHGHPQLCRKTDRLLLSTASPGLQEPLAPSAACLSLGWLVWPCWLASQDELGSMPSASILWKSLVLFYSLDVWWNLPVMLSRPSTFFSGKIINYLNSLIDIGLCMYLFLLSWVLAVCIFWNWSTLSVIKLWT